MTTKTGSLHLVSSAVALVVGTMAAAAYGQMTLDSLTGPVDANEIASFKAFLASHPATTPAAGTGNWMADGRPGTYTHGLGLMYEVTHDMTILDGMIGYAEALLAGRNNTTTGQIMWTGERELVWVTKPSTASNVGYAGSEQGWGLGHIAYCAKLILETPSIWNMTVPDGNPHGWGVTYLDRAKSFVTEADKTEDTYVVKYFVDPTTFAVRDPPSAAWTAMGENCWAWNRQMMFANGFQRLAEDHALLGDFPDKVTLYDNVVNVTVNAFLKNGLTTQGKTGEAYNWGYGPPDPKAEAASFHGAWDIMGVWTAYTGCRYGVTTSQLRAFGNTLTDVVSLGSNQFTVNVDGSGGTQVGMESNDWIFLAAVNPTVYTIVAGADSVAGNPWSANSDMEFFADILWTKNAIYNSSFPTCASTDGGVATSDAASPTTDAGSLPAEGGTTPGRVDAGSPPRSAGLDSGSTGTVGGTGSAPVSSPATSGCACRAGAFRPGTTGGWGRLLVVGATVGSLFGRRRRGRAHAKTRDGLDGDCRPK